MAFGGDLILVLDNEYADTKLHTIVTLFLNLALNIQTPEEGLLELRSQLVPSLLPTVSATERLNDAGPCIFSTLTLVIVCRREDVRRQCTFELEPFIVRCALALQSALHLDHEGFGFHPLVRRTRRTQHHLMPIAVSSAGMKGCCGR